jgi:hypothetical protein
MHEEAKLWNNPLEYVTTFSTTKSSQTELNLQRGLRPIGRMLKRNWFIMCVDLTKICRKAVRRAWLGENRNVPATLTGSRKYLVESL